MVFYCRPEFVVPTSINSPFSYINKVSLIRTMCPKVASLLVIRIERGNGTITIQIRLKNSEFDGNSEDFLLFMI